MPYYKPSADASPKRMNDAHNTMPAVVPNAGGYDTKNDSDHHNDTSAPLIKVAFQPSNQPTNQPGNQPAVHTNTHTNSHITGTATTTAIGTATPHGLGPSGDLSGAHGHNRAALTDNILAINNEVVNDDLTAIRVWLRRYDASSHTFRAYRKEIERLYLWAQREAHKAFSSLDALDMQGYIRFMAEPTDAWCAPNVPRNSSEWRPFAGPLSESSRRQAVTVLNACFSFLVECGYLKANPLKLLPKSNFPKPYNARTVDRYLDEDTWRFFWDFIQQPPSKTSGKTDGSADDGTAWLHYERNRFLFSLLYLQSPRASEVASHAINSIVREHGNWWWRITGKGGKTAQIPFVDEAMEALLRYRAVRLHGEPPPYPRKNDTMPLLASLKGERFITPNMIYKIVKGEVARAANALAREGADDARIDALYAASTHWFRHTSLTHQANSGVDLRMLQATARHASIATTERYLHVAGDTWHKAINTRKLGAKKTTKP